MLRIDTHLIFDPDQTVETEKKKGENGNKGIRIHINFQKQGIWSFYGRHKSFEGFKTS